MGTRSRIGIEDGETGKVRSIYCHWDGYPDGVGQTLLDHYKDRGKVEELIALGDISVLGEEIGEKHDFNNGTAPYPTWTLAYGRDRGEKAIEAKEDASADDMYRRVCEGWEEYAYLYRQGIWLVTEVGGGAGPFLVKANDPEGVAPPDWRRLDTILAAEQT